MKINACIHCGRAEEDHHQFVAIAGPDGCVCNPKEWGDPANIPPVCKKYRHDKSIDEGLCADCEHEEACHKS